MVSLARHASLIDLRSHHAEQVYLVSEGESAQLRLDRIANSWQRSANRQGIDPDSAEAPRILTSGELTGLRDPLEKLILSAQEELDRLYQLVREGGLHDSAL